MRQQWSRLRHDLLANVEGAIEIELHGFCSWSRRDRCGASMSRRQTTKPFDSGCPASDFIVV
jgi:hypothetical protein